MSQVLMYSVFTIERDEAHGLRDERQPDCVKNYLLDAAIF